MNADVDLKELAAVQASLRHGFEEPVALGRAHVLVTHRRPKDWVKDPKTGLLVPDVRFTEKSGVLVPDEDSFDLLDQDESWNLIMNVGRIFLHTQGYGTSGLGANGLNYIALSNTAVTANPADTTLAGEIVANGLQRAQGTVTLPTGSGNQTTIDKVFTATGTQSAQTAALFTASSAGTINHALGFTQRNLITNDTLQITYTITLG